jgi:hypothetical protein
LSFLGIGHGYLDLFVARSCRLLGISERLGHLVTVTEDALISSEVIMPLIGDLLSLLIELHHLLRLLGRLGRRVINPYRQVRLGLGFLGFLSHDSLDHIQLVMGSKLYGS